MPNGIERRGTRDIQKSWTYSCEFIFVGGELYSSDWSTVTSIFPSTHRADTLSLLRPKGTQDRETTLTL